MLVNYNTGEITKCGGELELQNSDETIYKTSKYCLLDTNLCFCKAVKSKKDDSFIIAFHNLTTDGDDVTPMIMLLDFYEMMSTASSSIKYAELYHLFHKPQENRALLERCLQLARVLQATTFEKAILHCQADG